MIFKKKIKQYIHTHSSLSSSSSTRLEIYQIKMSAGKSHNFEYKRDWIYVFQREKIEIKKKTPKLATIVYAEEIQYHTYKVKNLKKLL